MCKRTLHRTLSWLLLVGSVRCGPWSLAAKDPAPRVTVATQKSFQSFTEDLVKAIQQHKMGLVCLS